VDESWKQDKLQLSQVGDPSDSCAFDLGNRAAGFIVHANFRTFSKNIAVEDIYLNVPWGDSSLALLGDPIEIAAPYSNYWFFGSQPFEIGREQVLNHQVVRPRPFGPGTVLQGLFLWYGLEEIPDEFTHNGDLPVGVIICDQFGDEYSFEFNLWIDRRNKRSLQKRPKRSREPLFKDKIYND
jgi:hypothetical protein